MTALNNQYTPRPLSISREYPGYQFYAVLRLEGRSADECLRYAALTVQNWLCERVSMAEGSVPDEIRCAPAARYMEVPPSDLKSIRLPFSEIISLPDEGVWALMVREPDPGVAARAFVTHVALRKGDNDWVEFGVCIDVVDRDPALAEVDKAYRPQFVRLLFETDGMTLKQVEPLPFRKLSTLSDRRGVARLKALADDPGNQLPMIVFTHAQQARPDAKDLERIMAEMMKLPPMPARPGFQAPPAPAANRPSHFLPYDAAEFARHIYGFARAYVACAEAFGELRSKFNRVRLNEGDILIVEPKAFGGGMRTLPYREGLNDAWYAGVLAELQSALQCYSKHKPFDFGGVLFEDDARQRMRSRELEALRASHLEKSDKLDRALALLEQERATNAGLVQHIGELKAQMRDEYSRGANSERQRAELLEAQMDQIRADNAALRARNEAMSPSFTELNAMREIVARVQSIQSLPKNNEEVLAYFLLVFQDRLDFTERGRKTAAKCDVNPDMLWECLYQVATVLVDLYRSGTHEIEKAFKERTSWDLAPTEGPQTRKVADYMNLRKDIYDGREISIEPHVKFPRSHQKTGAQYQRLHYAYDPLSRKVVVGYVGDHLESFLPSGAR